MMNPTQTIIQKRQHYFWLGRQYEDENNLPKAIEAYHEYSNHLSDSDKHIPHQWISKFYEDLGDIEKSLFHLEEFAKGLTSAKASDLFKEIGEKYSKLRLNEDAARCFQVAIEKNPTIGLRKKLDELKNGL